MKNVISLDLGASKVHMARISIPSYRIEGELKFPTRPKRGLKEIYKDIRESAKSLKDKNTIAIGLAVPGSIYPETRKVINMPNIPKSQNFDFAGKLAKDLKLPTFIENDANCFLIGEKQFGKAKSYQNIIGLTIGTGVGGGVMINGELYTGAHGVAGELGHIVIDKSSHTDFESLCSGKAISQRWKKISKKSGIHVQDLNQEFKKKNPEARKLYQELTEDYAAALMSIIYSFNPEAIVFGGGASSIITVLKPSIQKSFKKLKFQKAANTKILISSLPNAGLLGAAWLAKNSK